MEEEQAQQPAGPSAPSGLSAAAEAVRLTVREKCPQAAGDVIRNGAEGWLKTAQVLDLLESFDEWGLPLGAFPSAAPAGAHCYRSEDL